MVGVNNNNNEIFEWPIYSLLEETDFMYLLLGTNLKLFDLSPLFLYGIFDSKKPTSTSFGQLTYCIPFWKIFFNDKITATKEPKKNNKFFLLVK